MESRIAASYVRLNNSMGKLTGRSSQCGSDGLGEGNGVGCSGGSGL